MVNLNNVVLQKQQNKVTNSSNETNSSSDNSTNKSTVKSVEMPVKGRTNPLENKLTNPNEYIYVGSKNTGAMVNDIAGNKVINTSYDQITIVNNYNINQQNNVPVKKPTVEAKGSIRVMVNIDGKPDTALGNKLGYTSEGVVGSSIGDEGIKVPEGYKIDGVKYLYSKNSNPNLSDLKTYNW